jgi:hypothetical protein
MSLRSALIVCFCSLMMPGCNLIGLLQANGEAPNPTQNTAEPQIAAPKTKASQPVIAAAPANVEALLQPEDFTYLGAFRLPGDEERPRTFAYGGNAMTFNPDGDPAGAVDGFPGSLFVMGHDRIPYGELPDGDQVAEVNIPVPVMGKDLEALNNAEFLQNFSNVAAGAFSALDEIPKTGMAYLNRGDTGALIHLAWGAHLQPQDQASHAWFSADLSKPNMQGYWFIGQQDLYSVNGYLFEIPQNWAEENTGGRVLATGRMRDGGQGGMGPALFAYRPWQADGSPAANGSHLEEVPLLLYEKSSNTEEFIRNMRGYQHADEWEGGAWLTTASGKTAVLFAGTKATGEKTWYGYVHPGGADKVCVDAHVSDYPTCRLADGTLCPQSDMQGCCSEDTGGCISMRGWWSNRFDAQLILFNPDDLAKVAAGQMETWQPQPYASIDINEYLVLSPPEWEIQMVGSADQRRYRIGDVAFDRNSGLLYVLEQYADGAKPLVHVWQIK